eukprot:scaffold1504_cov417-Prasinococcus_capsulatus_cf.AAC.53
MATQTPVQARPMASLSAYQQKMVTVVYKTQCPPPSELAQTVRQFSSADARTVTKQLVLVALPRLALYPTVDLALAGNFLQLLSQQVRMTTVMEGASTSRGDSAGCVVCTA